MNHTIMYIMIADAGKILKEEIPFLMTTNVARSCHLVDADDVEPNE